MKNIWIGEEHPWWLFLSRVSSAIPAWKRHSVDTPIGSLWKQQWCQLVLKVMWMCFEGSWLILSGKMRPHLKRLLLSSRLNKIIDVFIFEKKIGLCRKLEFFDLQTWVCQKCVNFMKKFARALAFLSILKIHPGGFPRFQTLRKPAARARVQSTFNLSSQPR